MDERDGVAASLIRRCDVHILPEYVAYELFAISGYAFEPELRAGIHRRPVGFPER